MIIQRAITHQYQFQTLSILSGGLLLNLDLWAFWAPHVICYCVGAELILEYKIRCII